MKVSTRGRYGLKAMLDIAINSNGKCVSLKSIAKRQDISENYLEQIISDLKKAGLVKSMRGLKGGYELNALPIDIKIGDILRALEGSLAPVNCVDELTECEQWDLCATKIVWQKIFDSVNEVIDSMTLSFLVDQQLQLNKTNL